VIQAAPLLNKTDTELRVFFLKHDVQFNTLKEMIDSEPSLYGLNARCGTYKNSKGVGAIVDFSKSTTDELLRAGLNKNRIKQYLMLMDQLGIVAISRSFSEHQISFKISDGIYPYAGAKSICYVELGKPSVGCVKQNGKILLYRSMTDTGNSKDVQDPDDIHFCSIISDHWFITRDYHRYDED
jgi:hypothetical protein